MSSDIKEPNPENQFPRESNEQIDVRRSKMENMRKKGANPFKSGLKPDTFSRDFNTKYSERTKEELESETAVHRMAGRVMAFRDFGKAGFLQLQDGQGRFQSYVNKAKLGDDVFSIYKDYLDTGDLVWLEGTPMKTKTGEVSLKATRFEILTKSLRPLPEKFHGITDVELRYRQRYLDMIMNEQTRETFKVRSQIIASIRKIMTKLDFLEVETPMMHPLLGGATAKPFTTHHNTLNMDLILRVAPELHLKRLLVGGFDRVFEINRNFRNEGISIQHNPEFTMLEYYWAYATYEDAMNLTEDMFLELSRELKGEDHIIYQDEKISFKKPWERITVKDSIVKYGGLDKKSLETAQSIATAIRKQGLELPEHGIAGGEPDYGDLLLFAFEELVESKLMQPTFVTEYPTSVSPLSRRNEDNPDVVDRFELFIYGRELANSFTELNDPDDQYDRFCTQAKAKLLGNDEACDVDMDYIRALEYGMPPAAGEGIGIDRMVMLFTDSASIRDVILFPQMKKEMI